MTSRSTSASRREAPSSVRVVPTALLAVLLSVSLAACGGGGGGSSNPPAPSGLSYASPQTYAVGTPITALSPTVTGNVRSYSVTPPLPAGLTLNATTGTITGTPSSAAAAVAYTLTASNSSGSTTFALTISVAAASPVPPSGLSYPSPQSYPLGIAVAPLNPTVTGSVTSYSVSPALPAGLVLDVGNGQIAGTPTAVAAQAVYTVIAVNASGSATFGLSIAVTAGVPAAPTNLSYPSPRSYTVGSAITPLNPTVTGNVTAYSVSPALPAGLVLNAVTGQISGTPAAAAAQGVYTITASNNAGGTTFGLSITVSAALAAPSNLSYPSPQSYVVGSAVTALSPSATGTVTAYSVSPSLPAGLSLDLVTGQITGTPSAASSQAVYTVTASNASGSTTFGLAITVAIAPPSNLSYPSPQSYSVGAAITPLSPTVAGTVASYSVAPALPAGLSLDAVSGQIAGTPTAATAQAVYTITASNGSGSTTFGLSITIEIAAPSGLSYPSPQNYTVGTAIAPLVPSVTGTVTNYAASPALPAGLSLDPTSGLISGTPTAAATQYVYTITASNSAGSTTFGWTVTIELGPAQYTIGGTVAGLNGAGLVLTNNGVDDLAIGSDGAFVFDTLMANGASYVVEVATQPTSEQICTVADATGTVAGANVTNIAVICAAPSWGTAQLLETRFIWTPELAMNADGSAIAVWSVLSPARTAIGPAARIFASATGWGPIHDLASNSNAVDEPEPSVAINSGGDAVAIWVSRNSSLVRLNAYSASAGWLGETQLDGGSGLQAGNLITDQLVYSPKIATAPDGSAIAVWARSYFVNPNQAHVFARRYTVAGGWGPVEVVSNLLTGPGVPAVRVAQRIEIAMDDDGDATVVWSSQQFDNGFRLDFYANRYTVGSGWGSQSQLSSPGALFVDGAPQVLAAPDGSAMAVWAEAPTVGSRIQIYANRYVPGTGWEAPAIVSDQEPNRDQIRVHVADNANGEAIAVWTKTAGNGQPIAIYGNRYIAGAGWGSAEPIHIQPLGSTIVPGGASNRAAINDDGVAFALWYERGTWPEGATALGFLDPNAIVFSNVWGRRYVPGQGWGPAERISGPEHLDDNTATGYQQGDSLRVEVDEQGRALALWHYVSGQAVFNFPHKLWVNRFE